MIKINERYRTREGAKDYAVKGHPDIPVGTVVKVVHLGSPDMHFCEGIGNKGESVFYSIHSNHLAPLDDEKAVTLFDAARSASDGTEWKLTNAAPQHEVKKLNDYRVVWSKTLDDAGIGDDVPYYVLCRKDFEIIPAGPEKLNGVPLEKMDELHNAVGLIGELMKWPGAQIGKPGWTYEAFEPAPEPTVVTYHTQDQAYAAYRHECPELFA